MPVPFNLSIAGINFRLNFPGHDVVSTLDARYANFTTDAGAYEWKIDWGKPVFDTDARSVSFEERGHAWHFSREDFQAEWDTATGRGRALMEPSEYTVDSWLRVWISGLLLMQGGGLFHAAGLIRDNRGELFAGASGSGKTTLARACALEEILSDELTAVRRHGGAFTVHGTPFMGELGVGGSNRAAILKRFFLMHHGASGRIPVPRARALPELWGTLMCFSKSHIFLDAAMSLCDDMAAALPCESFAFDAHDSPWRLLDYDSGQQPGPAAAGCGLA